MTKEFRLDSLRPNSGSSKVRKRLGRGPGSGLGKTAGKGHKGQKARAGGAVARHFEGGQMPLYRRIPKLGFRSRADKSGENDCWKIVNVELLKGVASGTKLTREQVGALIGVRPGSAVSRRAKYKLLGKGTLASAVTVEVDAVSAGALATIEAAGGSVVVQAEQR